MNIKLRQLQAFKAIVDTGSVSEASVVLGLTQSSVSKLLAGFETELGFALFERVGRRLRLSQKGQMFLAKAGNAVELLEDIRTVAQDIRDNLGRRLRVSAIGPLAFGSVMPEAITRFAESYSEFTYSIEMKLRIEIEDWVLSGHSDIGLTLLPVTREQIRKRVFANTHAVAIVPAGHPLSERMAVSPADLERADIILPKSSVRLRVLVEADFVKAGVPLRLRYETSNAISTVHLVAQGLGVAVVDPFSLTAVPRSSITVIRWEPDTELSYGMIWPSFRELVPHEEKFFEDTQAVAKELIEPMENRLARA